MNKLLYAIAFIFVACLTAYSQSTVLTGGNTFSVGLCGGGAVYAWGSNGSGQIGQGLASASAYKSPTQVEFPASSAGVSFIQVNAGSGSHGLALDCKGHVWVWGANSCGQAGTGNLTAMGSGTATGTNTYAVTIAGVTAYTVGQYYTVTFTNATTPITTIPTLNINGLGAKTIDVTSSNITAGEILILRYSANGEFEIMNSGTTGGTTYAPSNTTCNTSPINIPLSVPSEVVLGAQSPGTGANAIFLHSIKSISGGNDFSMAIDSSGNLWTWGNNIYGELGNGVVGGISNTPVQVTKCSGGNLTNVVQVQGADYTTYALTADGKVWAWGQGGTNFLLGNGGASPAQSACAVPVVNSTGAQLSGIKQVAAGDGNGMALDSSGQVWTWGGDWGFGQLGQGGVYVSNNYASRVVAPGSPYASACATGCSYITGAKFIAAGQASSVVVLGNGDVVSFGGEGLFSCGSGDEMLSGTLGNGLVTNNATCVTTTWCTGYNGATNPPSSTPAGCTSYGVPTYVLTAAGDTLKNIVSVARGDAWYFATNIFGQTYAWGFNGGGTTASPGVPAALATAGNYGGELGIGNTIDQPYATKITLPSGCLISVPCPDKPSLGSNFSICPSSSFTLNADESNTGYNYRWYSNSTNAGRVSTWTPLTATTKGDSAYTVSSLGTTATWFGVVVSYTDPCGNVCSQSDSVKVSPIVPPWTLSGNFCSTDTSVQFIATDPSKLAKFEWFSSLTAPTPLAGATGAPEDTVIIVGKHVANTSYKIGKTCPYALFVTDTATYKGVLKPTAPCTPGTSANVSASNTSTNPATASNNGTFLMVKVNQKNVTLKSLQFELMGNGTATFSFSIYADAGTGFNCNSPCTPSAGPQYEGVANGQSALYTSPATILANTTTSYVTETLLGNYTFPSTGVYWIGLNLTAPSNNPQYGVFGSGTCAAPTYANGQWSGTSIWPDNTTYNIIEGVDASYQQTVQYQGAVYNLNFTYKSPFTCSRMLVCANDSVTCAQPVKFLAFTATQQTPSVLLNWSTASEQNSSYFEVQRSTDGTNFVNIGQVPAAGNSAIIKNYTFTDNSASEFSGTIYYRIVEYDIDNATTTSVIQSVSTGKGKDVTIIPNPNNGNFEVVVAGETEVLNLTLYNSVGQVVYTAVGKAQGSIFTKYINIQNLPAAVYYLNISSPSNSWVKKIVKE